jgi:serine-type anaerobic sulfatase-maturating enzyme
MPDMPLAFHIMAKPIGPICNIDCTYCFYLDKEKLYPYKKNFRMPDDVLESFIRQKIKNHQVHKVNFSWQGGEPTLLGVEYFRNVVNLQKKYAQGHHIENSFQTNGILLDDAWCTFFKENNFLVGLSIDGPEEIHNRYRRNKGGKATFKQVMHGLGFLKKHQVEFNTLTVIQAHNSQKPLDVYNFLKEVGSGFMQFIPVVEQNNSSPQRVTDWSVEPGQFGRFLCAIFDEWVRNDVGRYYVQLFDLALEAWYGMEPGLCVFRETCGTAMAMEHNGDLYSCDHYVYPENKLGNIMASPMASLIISELQVQFGKNKLDKLPAYCRKCEVRFMCNGECPKNRFVSTPDGEPGLNYLCAGYKKIFKHIDPYMRFMVSELKNKRPPANVMNWAKDH